METTAVEAMPIRIAQSSYPTYEEWKLLPEKPNRINHFVLILPMRNGNQGLKLLLV